MWDNWKKIDLEIKNWNSVPGFVAILVIWLCLNYLSFFDLLLITWQII